MNLRLQDKVVIVTGGAKGIGKGSVEVLAKEGAITVIVGRNATDNQLVVDEIEAAGGKAWQVSAELSIPEECEKAVKAVIEKF